MFTGIIGWIVLGFVGGYFASRDVNGRGEGVALAVVPGKVGADPRPVPQFIFR
jgi:uncharacterized membrane protein YeaQ/YmgE (transglycosylase-associated protein family)